MSPRSSIDCVNRRPIADAKAFRDRRGTQPLLFQLAHFENGLRIQFRRIVVLPLQVWPPSSFKAVCRVILLLPKLQVGGITARWFIASVLNLKTFWNFSIFGGPGKTVREHVDAVGYIKPTVAANGAPAREKPTVIRASNHDLTPKSVCCCGVVHSLILHIRLIFSTFLKGNSL
jgi:hypothetical protein